MGKWRKKQETKGEQKKTKGNEGKQRKHGKTKVPRQPKETDIQNLTPPLGKSRNRKPGSYDIGF